MIEIVRDCEISEGTCVYRVVANRQSICTFEHDRHDGLAVCLQKAADAVELSEWADLVLLDEIKGG